MDLPSPPRAVAAAGPLAPNSYSRARLLRQMHAGGLLSVDEARRAGLVLDTHPTATGEDGVDVSGAPG